jgi:outer membrane lipoprotein LolB
MFASQSRHYEMNSMKFSPQYFVFIRQLTIIAVLFALTACASRPSLESQTVVKLNNNLAQLQKWKLSGKIAWITASERKSAYMNWQQNVENMQFELSNLVGINLASLNYNGKIATLKADGKEYHDPSPSFLIYKTTGWNVPLKPLTSWVKGAVTSQGRLSGKTAASNSQKLIRYENGLIKQIKPNCEKCDQWTIDYTAYENVLIGENEYQLPKQISMFNSASQATIKIRISQWSQ